MNNKNKKITVGLLFGGASPEHDVSIMSCKNVYSAIDKEKYNVILIKISRAGEWLLCDSNFLKKEKIKFNSNLTIKNLNVDLFFPIMHGTNCEDGKLQAFLELMGKPYVGSDAKSSMIGMDKVLQKDLLQGEVPMLEYVSYNKNNKLPTSLNSLISRNGKKLEYPIFVKPANGGSSLGISKAKDDEGLKIAISESFLYDTKIIIEQGLDAPKELECAILGDVAVEVGEVIPAKEFYDYNDKYFDGKARTEIPAKIDKTLRNQIKNYSEKIFKILGCRHFSRIDFLYKDGKLYFNEINTIPGFTNISMYPKICSSCGINYKKLIDKLINYALL